MSDLSGKFGDLQTQMTSEADAAHLQRETIESTLENIQTAIAFLNSDMLLMKSALLSAIGQQDPCATCPPPSLITPPTSPDTQPVDSDRCKRAQALIHALATICGVFGAAADSGVTWSPSIVVSGITEVVTALITGGSPPLPSFPESVNIAGDTINYALSNIGRGNALGSEFSSISSGMLFPIFSAGTPAAAQSNYGAYVASTSLPNDEKLLITALGFNALFSYYLDPASTPDLTGYDGTICGVGGCQTIETEMVSVDGGGALPIIVWPSVFLPSATEPGHSASAPVWCTINLAGYLITASKDANIFYFSGGSATPITAGVQFVADGGDNTAIVARGHTDPFTIDICPPAE